MFDDDGTAFSADRSVLESQSPVLRKWLISHDKEKKKIFKIGDLNSETVEGMLEFMHGEVVANFKELAGWLLVAADLYKVSGLKTVCERQLAENLVLEIVVETLNVTEYHRSELLMEVGLELIIENNNEFKDQDGVEKVIKECSSSLAVKMINILLD